VGVLTAEDLQAELESRGLTLEAAGVIARVHASTVSRIIAGKVRASPATVVALARGLGIGAKRMQRMCDAHYYAAHPDEAVAV